MKSLKYLSFLALLGLSSIGSVWAGHGVRVGVGMYFGAPVSPWYGYPPPYYYYPPYYPPPVYIEQNGALPPPPPPVASAPRANDWYFCEAPQAYYPYVKECPEGWLRVAPQSVPPDVRR